MVNSEKEKIALVEEVYMQLKQRKDDYVFHGETTEIISRLAPYCRSDRETLFWFLGGMIFWIINWRVTKKMYKQQNISKIEQRMISILSDYEMTLKKGYCILIRKHQE